MSQLLENAKRNVEVLRTQRARLFKAFDIYKSNIEYGVISETDSQHEIIVAWYRACLDLDYNAINNYPPVLEKYLW